MNKTSKSPKLSQPFMSHTPNPVSSPPKKQFPSVSLSKHMQDYKAYRSYENKKKFPDIEKSNSYMISPEEKSILINRNMEMPSIHNAHQMMLTDNLNETKIQKLQQQILKSLGEARTLKKEEEWRLYMTKSELIEDKSAEFQEIEEYLLKFISKSIQHTLAFTQTFNLNLFNKEGDTNRETSQMVNIETTNDRKMNKTSSSFLESANALNKKSVQPSLRVLKEQLNTLALGGKDASFNEMNNTKTAINFKPGDKTALIEKIQARHQEEINKLTFERSLLEKKLELYQARILHLENRMREENIPIENETPETSLFTSNGTEDPVIKRPRRQTSAEEQMMNNLINQNKYKSEAEFKQIQNETLIKELTMVKEHAFKIKMENEKLKLQVESLEKECSECREYKKYRELWLMQAEETIGWKNLWREKKDETVKLGNKIKILKEKNKQLLHSFNFSMVVNPDQEEDKQELENIIKSFQEWLKVMSVPRVNCPIVDTKSFMEEGGLKEQEYMPDHEHLNYKLLRPNFFIFFESYEKTIMMEKNILNTRPLQPTFFVKIRAILDSMYNHFNSYGHFKHWTSFPQFVIGFLEKYEISFTTLKIEPRKKPMPSQEKLTFLMNLFNKKLSNTWECDMFRSFILEEYTLDEIYFFLDCRNDLNGGMTLTHGFGIVDPVSYVKLHKALATTQRKLSPYENYIIERVKTILKSRRREKNGQFFIDRYFVLKLLLEVYALEKTKSERIFEASFKTKPSTKTKSLISYADYFAFMTKNFQFLSTIDICELYRETYALSSGKITYKAIHFICQSKGLFIPLIWAKRLNMNVLDKSLNSDMILLDLQNNTRKMNSYLVEMGVEEVARLENDLNYFLRQVDWYRNNRQVFYFKIQEIKMKILKANSLLDWQSSTYTPNELLSTDEIREGIMQIHGLIHHSDNSLRILNKKKEEKEKAIKQITRNFKIRIQESMKEFKRIDEEQMRKLKNQMALEIKLRNKREKEEAEAGEKPVDGNEEKSNLTSVNEMNVNATDASDGKTGAKFSLVESKKEDDEDDENNESNDSVKEDHFAGRRGSKLQTIAEANEVAS